MTSCAVSDAASKIIALGGRRPAVIQALVSSTPMCYECVRVNLSWQKDFRAKGLNMRVTREVRECSGVFITELALVPLLKAFVGSGHDGLQYCQDRSGSVKMMIGIVMMV